MKKIAALTSCALLLLLFVHCGPREQTSRVLILGLDGLDPQTIDLLMSEGKLPNFARLRQEGAYGRLISQKPLLSPIIWTTIATGKGAADHGIGHFVAVNPQTGEQLPVTSRMRKVKALWNIASDAGRKIASVGWWATWPPEEVNGAMISDHTAYHFLFEEGLADESKEEVKTFPEELLSEITPKLRRPGDLTLDDLTPFVDVTPEDLDRTFDFSDDLAHFRWALATAQSYRDIGLDLWKEENPDLALVYIEGVDSSSHLFGHLFRAENLAGELAVQQDRYGQTVEQMYLFADELVGHYIEVMDERTTLMVLSDHGFELGALHDDPTKTRDLRRVSEKFHRIEGILYLYGHRVKANALIDRPSILDITPTTLSLLGLPPASDMPGRILTEAFREEVPTDRIPTYEGAGGFSQAEGGTGDSTVDPALLEHLESLGYLGGDEEATHSPQGDRNLAAIHFQNGQFREAAKIYQTLLEQNPNDASLYTSLAGALGAMGRYDQAMKQLTQAIEIQPLNSEAYHNRAVIWERRGETQRAIDDYTTALRYQPGYEPSRIALRRLTGQADVRAPRSEKEARAAHLTEQASQAARRGQYQEAMALLDQAQEAAPNYVVVYQYRSNVAYLMGQHDRAIQALEKALEIEPDNALFRENLKRLREEG